MKNFLSLPLILATLISCNNNNHKMSDNTIAPADSIKTLAYPKTAKGTVTDDYFGTKVPDPYRWLENDTSAETKAWVIAENKVTQNYLKQIPYRKAMKDRLTELWNYEKFSAPFKEGA
jgi:prolyl oligopeptidase